MIQIGRAGAENIGQAEATVLELQEVRDYVWSSRMGMLVSKGIAFLSLLY